MSIISTNFSPENIDVSEIKYFKQILMRWSLAI